MKGVETSFGLIKTINEDVNISEDDKSSESDIEISVPAKKRKKRDRYFTPSFSFKIKDNEDYLNDDVEEDCAVDRKKKVMSTTLEEKIQKMRHTLKEEHSSKGDDVESSDGEESLSDDEIVADNLKVKEKRRRDKKTMPIRNGIDSWGEKINFTEVVTEYDTSLSFKDMNISRPLLKGLTERKLERPTPVQAATIPLALRGRDLCVCAVTGSGKTCAFLIPVVERLVHRPKNAQPATRVLVLVPTRELAVQVHKVCERLIAETSLVACLSAGGLDIKAQEAALRRFPDIVISTPGRLIDHIHNSINFTLQNIEILILDEADRMLDEFFQEQMGEIIKSCSRNRQTMLFSATMTEQLQHLVKLSLREPVKVFINESTEVAMGLRQEFVRIREGREGDRESILAALVCRTFRERVMVFIQTKVQAHRMHVLLKLLGVRVGELHGNLSQLQRLQTLKEFQLGSIDVLLATDLASRGLDISDVRTIINLTMPNSFSHYIHRVGRTARAGRSGRSVSLVGEAERRILKEVVKHAKNPVKIRVIPSEVLQKYSAKVAKCEPHVQEVFRLEKEEHMLRAAEHQVCRIEKRLADDGQPGIKRTWFQSHKEREAEKEKSIVGEKNRKVLSKRNKRIEETKKQFNADDRMGREIRKAQEYAARVAKRSRRIPRIRTDEESTRNKKSARDPKNAKQKSFFTEDLTSTGRKALKKLRYGPSYEDKKKYGLLKKGSKRKVGKKR